MKEPELCSEMNRKTASSPLQPRLLYIRLETAVNNTLFAHAKRTGASAWSKSHDSNHRCAGPLRFTCRLFRHRPQRSL